uniref:Signal recognition particle 14 kDa protein n=1 Tax=Strigamia maritima TaxID=126957 RepID=T1IPU6_STRMM
MAILENDTFLSELTRLFQKSRQTGSLSISMKRYDGRSKPVSKTPRNLPSPPSEYKCLIRAKLGNKKISTVIHAKDINKFQLAYASVLKGNMDALKKRDKKASKGKTIKGKATQLL